MSPVAIAVTAVTVIFALFLATVAWMVVVGRFTMIAAQIRDWVTADVDDQRPIGRHRAEHQPPDDGPSNGLHHRQ